MCGRFSLIVDASVLADVFNVDPPRGLTPRYNIAPTQVVPIVRVTDASHRELAEARWGLVPSWARDAKMGARMINARGESVAEKPSFRSAVKNKRCLVPASGFFEWVKNHDGSKTPHFIHFTDSRLFAFAGLWERWTKGGGEPLETFTIITTEPNEVVAPLHDRMPVILASDHFGEWLEPSPMRPDRLRELLSPCPAAGMEAYPVSTRVNSPANDDSSCVARLS
jgi:putative SOS response-associated peptidase YedK